MKILLVEDQKTLSYALAEILLQNKYSVEPVYDGEAGFDEAMTGIYDLIILDIMLPKIDGFRVLRSLRKEKISTPVLLLTAKSEIDDKIQGLDFGADDYLTKPFEMRELLARVRALTRRKGEFIGDELTYSDLKLNCLNHILFCKERQINLGKKEYQIIEMLMKNENKIISKEEFITKVWGYNSDAEYNNIEVYISFLRKKLASIKSGVIIKANRNLGYCLEKHV